MQFNVPQFIDIEDKIVGPLTAKQLGWVSLGGIIFLILWKTLDVSALVIYGAIDAAVFGALAFYKPYNQPLPKFIVSSVLFIFRPRVYVWRRTYDNIKTVKKNTVAKKIELPKRKTLDSKKIVEISKILDRQNH